MLQLWDKCIYRFGSCYSCGRNIFIVMTHATAVCQIRCHHVSYYSPRVSKHCQAACHSNSVKHCYFGTCHSCGANTHYLHSLRLVRTHSIIVVQATAVGQRHYHHGSCNSCGTTTPSSWMMPQPWDRDTIIMDHATAMGQRHHHHGSCHSHGTETPSSWIMPQPWDRDTIIMDHATAMGQRHHHHGSCHSHGTKTPSSWIMPQPSDHTTADCTIMG